MYTKLFQEIGLSPNEAKIYATLIEEGESSAGEISQKSQIHRRNVYDATKRLVEKGLVFQILGKGENQFRATPPAKLLEIIKEKEQKINQVLPELQLKYDEKPHTKEVYVYRGVEGYKNYLRDILKEKQDVYLIASKAAWFDAQLKSFLTGFLLDCHRLEIKNHPIYDLGVKDKLPGEIKISGQNYKFLPAEYSTRSEINIFGDKIACFSGLSIGGIDKDTTIYITIDQTLAEGYKTWFKFVWMHLPTPD